MATRNLEVFYSGAPALHDVALNIYGNEVTSLIVPSGCGKSTFIRSLNRMNDTIENCSVEDAVFLDGGDIYGRGLDVAQLRTRIATVFQKPNPFPKFHRIAKDKEELNGIVLGGLERTDLLDEVRDRLDMSGTSFSRGQQQRLCIAHSIAVRPEVILMDESCSALDPIATARIGELITELKAQYTIVIVTYSMQQARRFSDKTAYFQLSRIIEHGDTENLFETAQDERTSDYVMRRIG